MSATWHIVAGGYNLTTLIVDENSQTLFQIPGPPGEFAERLIRAVNSHDALKRQLRTCCCGYHNCNACKRSDAALRLAGVEPSGGTG